MASFANLEGLFNNRCAPFDAHKKTAA